MSTQRQSLDTVTIYKPFVKLFSLETAYFLDYLLNWSGETTDAGFFWQTTAELKQETGLTTYAITKARNDLQSMGFIEMRVMRANGSPIVHYRVNEKVINEALDGKYRIPKPRPSKPPKAGWLYVIRCQNLYKIGVATDVDKRLRQLAKPIPFNLHLIHKSYYYDVIAAERHVHRRYRHKRVTGEWFQLTEEDLTWFETTWFKTL